MPFGSPGPSHTARERDRRERLGDSDRRAQRLGDCRREPRELRSAAAQDDVLDRDRGSRVHEIGDRVAHAREHLVDELVDGLESRTLRGGDPRRGHADQPLELLRLANRNLEPCGDGAGQVVAAARDDADELRNAADHHDDRRRRRPDVQERVRAGRSERAAVEPTDRERDEVDVDRDESRRLHGSYRREHRRLDCRDEEAVVDRSLLATVPR